MTEEIQIHGKTPFYKKRFFWVLIGSVVSVLVIVFTGGTAALAGTAFIGKIATATGLTAKTIAGGTTLLCAAAGGAVTGCVAHELEKTKKENKRLRQRLQESLAESKEAQEMADRAIDSNTETARHTKKVVEKNKELEKKLEEKEEQLKQQLEEKEKQLKQQLEEKEKQLKQQLEEKEEQLKQQGVMPQESFLQSFECPVTFEVMKKPMISTKCGHSVDEKALPLLFGREQKTVPCPLCSKPVSRKEFVCDYSLKSIISDFYRCGLLKGESQTDVNKNQQELKEEQKFTKS